VTDTSGHVVEINFQMVFQKMGTLTNGNDLLMMVPDSLAIICYPLGITIGVG
jgi:hypothetical protein